MANKSWDCKRAVFYGGTNGSGKTTLRSIAEDDIKINIDPDAEARKINPNNPRSADISAGKKALELFGDALSLDLSFTMESTLTGKSILKRMQEASDKGYFVELRYVGLRSEDLNVSRVESRVAKGGHHIEESVIRKRYQDSRNNLSLAIGIADLVVIWDNSSEKIFECAKIENGKVEYVEGKEIPDWVTSVTKEYEKGLSSQRPAPSIFKVVKMSESDGISTEPPSSDFFDGKKKGGLLDDPEP